MYTAWNCTNGNTKVPDQSCDSSPGVMLALQKHFGVAPERFPRTSFNAMVQGVMEIRAMALAAPPPETRLMPWLNAKSFCYVCTPTHYYQERILHYALSGSENFYCKNDLAFVPTCSLS